ncbi:SCO family protein [Nonlabens sp. MB-3u-79]|nr:SCO family protein [Nonlabens sp. MB-3u-79]
MVNYTITMKQKMAEYLVLKEPYFALVSRISLWCLILCSALFASSCKTEKKQAVAKAQNEVTSRVEALPYYGEATFTPHWFSSDSDSLKNFHKIPDFELTNQNGELITNATFENKIYITDFFFTVCPGICPKMTENMTRIQEEFIENDEVLLLSHSVTPDYDTPEVLQKYAKRKKVNPKKWHLVTGDKELIYDLGRNQYFVEEDLGITKDVNDFLHTENFILIDQNKHIRGIYNGLNKASIGQLILDVRTLQAE